MNFKSTPLILLLLLFFSAGLLAEGQQERPPFPETVEIPEPGKDTYETTEALLEYESLDLYGDEYGNVDDVIVDIGTGYLAYVVLAVPQEGGTGTRLVPIPYSYFIPDGEAMTLRLGFDDPSIIADAPGYAPRADFVDQYADEYGFLRDLRFYWGTAAAQIPEALTQRMLQTRPDVGVAGYGGGVRVFPDTLESLKNLIGARITGLHQETAGWIEEIAWELVSGSVASVFFNNADDDKIYPIPAGLMIYDMRDNVISLDKEHLSFEGARTISTTEITAVTHRGNLFNRFHSYWVGRQPWLLFRTGIRILPAVRLTATRIQDFVVQSSRGVRVGTITDALIRRNGTVPFVFMVPEAGIVDTADKWYPIPAEALSVDRIHFQNQVLLDLTNDEIDDLPQFDRGELPDTTVPDWVARLREYWKEILTPGQTGQAAALQITKEEGPAPQAVLVTDFMAFEIRNKSNELLGSVRDLVINLDHNNVDYVIFSFEEALDEDEYLYPIPFEALDLTDSFDGLVIDTTTRELLAAPRFQRGDRLIVDKEEWSAIALEYWIE